MQPAAPQTVHSAGTRVSATSSATRTTETPAAPIAFISGAVKTISPASEMPTVRPEKSTVRPAVATVRAVARRTCARVDLAGRRRRGAARCSSSRNRLTTSRP